MNLERLNNIMWFNKKNSNCSYSTVTVNGKTIRVHGNNISIINDEVIVDGRPLDDAFDQPNITVIVEGDCKILSASGNVEVRGNAGNIDCRGSCHIYGNVTGNVDASGSVTCGDVGGNIDASGSVRCIRK
jgi:hypothetical protein